VPTNATGGADVAVDDGGTLHAVYQAGDGLQYRRSDGAPTLASVPNQHATTIDCSAPAAAVRLGANATPPAFSEVGGFAVWSEPVNGVASVRAVSLDPVTCGSAPPPPAPGDTTPPAMDIGRRLTMRKGVVFLTVGCPVEEASCTGSAELARAPRHGSVPGAPLGKAARFKLGGGDSKRLKLKLSKKTLKLFRKHRSLKVMVVVDAADALGNAGTNVHRAVLFFHA
jgi:hypothetical protein